MESVESIIAETGYTAAGLSIEIRQGCAPAGRSPGNSQSAVERRELGVRRLGETQPAFCPTGPLRFDWETTELRRATLGGGR
ncbi:hypothetical protein K0M31_011785, partial [Melipona bicolor]